MNAQDKAVARQMLELKLLTIEQVEALRAEVERTGRSFEDVAAALGAKKPAPAPAPPPRPLKTPPTPAREARFPALYLALMTASALIFSVLLIMSLNRLAENSAKDRDLAVEQSKVITEAERQASEARLGYQRSIVAAREAKAKQALTKAREAMARVGDKPATSPDVVLALNEAFVGYNGYLEVLPDDADVRLERARTHELRRNYDLAIADLERAAQLKPDRAPALQDKIAQLRLLLARTPK